MEKYTVISMPDAGKRIKKNHPVIRRLPPKYAELCLKYLCAQVSGTINDRDTDTELGYMMDVPGFLFDWDKLPSREREKQIKGIIHRMEDMESTVLCFPQIHDYLEQEEAAYIEQCGIVILDGYKIKIGSLMLALQQIIKMLGEDVTQYEVGVWGADSDLGKVWVEMLAGHVNQMCIGGANIRVLRALADKMLRTTGLSCQVTLNPMTCLYKKNITVLMEKVSAVYNPCKGSFNFLSYRINDTRSIIQTVSDAGYNIQSGWIGFPQDLCIESSLHIWEELGVIEGLFYIISRIYREDILLNKVSLKQMQCLIGLFNAYPLRLHGLISSGRRIGLERLRMDYYRSIRQNLDQKNCFP